MTSPIKRGMEVALGRFYSVMLESTQDEDLGELFSKLASIEQGHKEMIFSLYRSIEASGMDLPSFESRVRAQVMEGGFDIEVFLKENEPFMKTVPDALNVAMMIEAQAMDLYLRYADRSKEVSTKEVLFKIADEEKVHLNPLGELIGQSARKACFAFFFTSREGHARYWNTVWKPILSFSGNINDRLRPSLLAPFTLLVCPISHQISCLG